MRLGMEGRIMFGSIIVSFVGICLPVVAGLMLAPRNIDKSTQEWRSHLRSLMAAIQTKIAMKDLPADLGSTSTYPTG
jgi:hypothetical protein